MCVPLLVRLVGVRFADRKKIHWRGMRVVSPPNVKSLDNPDRTNKKFADKGFHFKKEMTWSRQRHATIPSGGGGRTN